jgi:prepilin-type N-terminal cleavage/methylation domain-containing protein
MRKAFTLIEMIFTIVIMAGIFMVIPKIVMIAGKNESFAIKQDAYLNAISLTKLASSLAWDEANVHSLDILSTSTAPIECNATSHYIRVGSFLSENARTCKENLSASNIGSEEGSDYLTFDDIDDFNGTTINTTTHGAIKYQIETIVEYLSPAISYANHHMDINLHTSTPTILSSDIKKLVTTIKYNGKRASRQGEVLATFHYNSANIGQFTLNKREW